MLYFTIPQPCLDSPDALKHYPEDPGAYMPQAYFLIDS
jgi:hypothetical protein